MLVLVAVVISGGYVAWRVIQSEYYVGTADGRVVVFRGVNGAVAGLTFSSMVQQTNIPIAGMPSGEAGQIAATIPAASLAQAQKIVARIRRDYNCAVGQAHIRTWAANQRKHAASATSKRPLARFGQTSARRLTSGRKAAADPKSTPAPSRRAATTRPKASASPKPSRKTAPSPKPQASQQPKPVLPRYCPAYPEDAG
jgi:hypothetical protein